MRLTGGIETNSPMHGNPFRKSKAVGMSRPTKFQCQIDYKSWADMPFNTFLYIGSMSSTKFPW